MFTPSGTEVEMPVKNFAELTQLSDEDLARMKLSLAGSALILKQHDLHISIAPLVAASKPLMSMVGSGSVSQRQSKE